MTLVYLALQMRQNAAAQERTAALASGSAIHASADRWSVFRQMLTEESTADVWSKACNDEALMDSERIRVRAVLQEMTYSALATIEHWRVTGNESYIGGVASAVAVELEGSRTMLDAWAQMSAELGFFGFEDFADEVREKLEGALQSMGGDS